MNLASLTTDRRTSVEQPSHGVRIGLALGSGSARGLAHIGVIRAIEEAGIKVDVIAGTSIGALVGAAYASGRLDALELSFREFDWKSVGSLFDPVFPRSGLIDGKKISKFIRAHVLGPNIEHLPVPFSAIAADIANGEEVTMCEGDLVVAIRASISVPGILTPVHREGRLLVDGGLVDPVPVSAARALGANLVIAVDLNHEIVEGKQMRRRTLRRRVPRTILDRLSLNEYARAATMIREKFRVRKRLAPPRGRTIAARPRSPGMIELLLSSLHIMQVRVTESRLSIERPEVLIRPPLGSVHLLEFDRAEEMIAIGYASAQEPIRELARQLESHDRSSS